MNNNSDYDDYYNDDFDDLQIDEYELISTPNDFNVLTIFNFIETGAIILPPFQRNYVWDQKRASKLIESLILGLPVPQIFLYEKSKNSFLVIDGQQRLLTIYYFIKNRFPNADKRAEIRKYQNTQKKFAPDILDDETLFNKFSLKFQDIESDYKNKFQDLEYETLGDYQSQFNLRPIRIIIVKQTSPENDESSILEIFHRLNTGGINLKSQEIRASLFYSPFYEMILKLNNSQNWRRLIGNKVNDAHLEDLEIILRGFAFLINYENYISPLSKFLNLFAKEAKNFDSDKIDYLQDLFKTFCDALAPMPEKILYNQNKGRFSKPLFEVVFYIICHDAYLSHSLKIHEIEESDITKLGASEEFLAASQDMTTKITNVKKRMNIARKILNRE
jgi:hypothetical protein